MPNISVKYAIAVYANKGGVGKSTVAVNLACSLMKHHGMKVGILDADIHGPSLPSQITPKDTTIKFSDCGYYVNAVYYEGMPTMSFGYLRKKVSGGTMARETAVRGSAAAKLANQMADGVHWGDLDFLIVDFPPGTADMVLTLSKTLTFCAAVCVTTPNDLSIVDVEKGLATFNMLGVPTVAMVENMSYFECAHGERHYPFGKGCIRELTCNAEQLRGAPVGLFALPLNPVLCQSTGTPFVLSDPYSEIALVFRDLARNVLNNTMHIADAAGQEQQSIIHRPLYDREWWDSCLSTATLSLFQ